MEGKISTIVSVSEESNEEELYINKVVVNNPRSYVKKPSILCIGKNYA